VTMPATRLTVVPAILTQPPQDQVVYLGGTARFEAQVKASEPLSYQWRFNGREMEAETNPALVIPNVRWPQEGTYSLLVSNRFGPVLTGEARLSLVNVAGWGNNAPAQWDLYAGQATVPAGVSNIVAIGGGGHHSLALSAGGTVAAWGDNGFGQTGIPGGLSNVVAVAAGYAHSLALRADGTVTAWGLNNQGQSDVPASLSNIVAIAAGQYHNLALRADGTVAAWGGATDMPAGLSNVVAIAGGYAHSLVLRADGTVVAWGMQNTLPSGLSNVTAIASGYGHCLALRADGTVTAWGDNSLGQTNVPGGLTNAVAIASGASHCLALRADGTVVAWGYNDYGQTNVPADLSNVVAIAGGGGHSLAVVGESPPILKAPLVNPFLSNGVFTVSLPSQSSRVYALEFKNSFNVGIWTALPLLAGNGGRLTLTDPTATSTGRFYRVRQW